tara:strand:- start:2009 stop:3436 length:1428 start_codon:yes stop_codon:yes gene_type:complete
MSITVFLHWASIGFGLFAAILLFLDQRKGADAARSAFRESLATSWAHIRGSSLWRLPERLLQIFIVSAEATNNSAVRFFDQVWVTVMVAGFVLIIEQLENGNGGLERIRWISTILTFATYFIFRYRLLGRWLNKLGKDGSSLFWIVIAALSAVAVVATATHAMNFVALFNHGLTVPQALIYVPVLMFLLRLAYMRVIVFPAVRIRDWDVRRKTHFRDTVDAYMSIQAYLEDRDDDDGNAPSAGTVYRMAHWEADRKHSQRSEKLRKPLMRFKTVFNTMQIGFLLSTILTVAGLSLGRHFDPESQLSLTPQILMVNTIFDALTIGVTLGLMQWVSYGSFAGSWSVRLVLAAPFDLVVAAVFSVLSLYLSLAGTDNAVGLSEAVDLLIPDVDGQNIFGLGPEFWIMHTTFIPTCIYLLVLATGAIVYLLFISLLAQVVSENPEEITNPFQGLAAVFGLYAVAGEIVAFTTTDWRFFG